MLLESSLISEGLRRYRDLRVRRKLILIIGLAIAFAVLFAGTAVLAYESRTFKPRSLQTARTQAEILGEIMVPPLLFRDSNTAAGYLSTLGYWKDVKEAAVYNAQGALFATYRRNSNLPSNPPAQAPESGARFGSRSLDYSSPVSGDGHADIGTIWLNVDLPPLFARLPQYGIMFTVITLSLLAVAVLLERALKYSVSAPITSLAGTALSVIEKQDYSLRAAPYGRDEIGNLTGAFNLMLQAIEQRNLSLRESEERFSKAFHASPTPMSILRVEDGMFIDINESSLEMLGFTREEVIGRSPMQLGIIDAKQFERLAGTMESQGAIRNLEFSITMKTGEKRDALASIEAIEIGGWKCFLATSNDITERKLVEEQLRQSQKMEAIGRLAGGIAHDFNNLLTAINGYSALALQSMDPSHPLFEFLGEILKAGQRAAALTKQLLAYGRKQILEPKLWDLSSIVRDMQAMLIRLIGEDVIFVADLKSNIGQAKVDRGQVEQIILNLVINARDAMPEGGRLTLETGHVILDHTDSMTHFEAYPGAYLVLTVSDTGVGMTPDVQAKIFEPFFTTKDVAKGTGLGLSVVYGIVKQSGGSISVDSEPGRGTTFRVFFPEAERLEDRTADLSPKDEGTGYGGFETILLVEDEQSVRKFTRLALENLGYRVLEAGNGIEALGRLKADSARVHLVITDVVMPEMGGLDLADRIHADLPALPVLFVTGYPEHGFQRAKELKAGEMVLQKPYNPPELARMVRESLKKEG